MQLLLLCEQGAEYSAKNLKGLKVEHALESFSEGKTVILTLKDKGLFINAWAS